MIVLIRYRCMMGVKVVWKGMEEGQGRHYSPLGCDGEQMDGRQRAISSYVRGRRESATVI